MTLSLKKGITEALLYFFCAYLKGSTQEQLEEMMTPEKYAKYKEISLPNAEKIVKLGLAFRDISEKEKVRMSVYLYILTTDLANRPTVALHSLNLIILIYFLLFRLRWFKQKSKTNSI